MKLAVINFSVNVGKTTVARHLLAPRIPGCQVNSVESINVDDGQPVTIRGRQFAQLQEFLQGADDVVITGASNVSQGRCRSDLKNLERLVFTVALGISSASVCAAFFVWLADSADL